MAPATRPDRFDTAARADTDIALLDLEDSVPHHAKDTAREAALRFLATNAGSGTDGGRTPTFGLRLNALSTLHGLKDLVAVAENDHTPAILLVPKVESPRDIDIVAHTVDPDGTGPNRV